MLSWIHRSNFFLKFSPSLFRIDVDWCQMTLIDDYWYWVMLIGANWFRAHPRHLDDIFTFAIPRNYNSAGAVWVPRISTVARAALCRIYSCCEGFQLRELIWPRSLFEQSEVRIRIGLKAVYPGSREDPGMNVGPAHLLDHRLDPWSVLKQNQHKKHHPVHLVKYNSIILATNICLVGSNSFDLTTKSVST